MSENERDRIIGTGYLFMDNWLAIFVEDNSMWSVNIRQQHGGLLCLQAQLRGRFAWVVCPAPHYDALDMETSGERLTDLAEIERILPEGATLDSRVPAYEALVPVKWHGQDAWLLWENSD